MRRCVFGLLVLGALSVGSVAADATYAASKSANGHLSGPVLVCAPSGACSPTAATVTVYQARNERLGRLVATQNASHGRFSFPLAPGLYMTRATAVHARLNGGNCVSTEARVRARSTTSTVIRCYIKAAH